jgi:hypothetical protein
VIVKNYQELYNQYWWKYRILEDYLKGLEERLKEEAYDFDTISEAEKLEEVLIKARDNSGYLY